MPLSPSTTPPSSTLLLPTYLFPTPLLWNTRRCACSRSMACTRTRWTRRCGSVPPCSGRTSDPERWPCSGSHRSQSRSCHGQKIYFSLPKKSHIDGFYLDDCHQLPPFANLPWSVVKTSFRKAPASGASSVSEVPVVWCAVVTFVSIHTGPTITDAIAVTLKLM